MQLELDMLDHLVSRIPTGIIKGHTLKDLHRGHAELMKEKH